MHQSLCTITLEVQPQNLKALHDCILELDRTVKKPSDKDVSDTDRSVNPYAKLAKEVPGLHFMSIMIFEDERYDPLVTIELNIDGDIGTFLPQIEVPVLQTYLRALIRCCKRPSNRKRRAMYDAITAPGSKLPLTPFLETCVLRPAAFHQGNRGLDRDRIFQNDALFKDLQKELKGPRFSRPADAEPNTPGLACRLVEQISLADNGASEPLDQARTHPRLCAIGGFLGYCPVLLVHTGHDPRPADASLGRDSGLLSRCLLVVAPDRGHFRRNRERRRETSRRTRSTPGMAPCPGNPSESWLPASWVS